MNRIIRKINIPSLSLDDVCYLLIIHKRLKLKETSAYSNVKYF